MLEWDSFLWTADEWFVTYSLLYVVSAPVKLFAIGHTVELYLKAANTKFTKDIDRAVKFGHNVKAIWDDCKRDPKFMPSFEIKNSVFDIDVLSVSEVEKLNEADRLHLFRNEELYMLVKFYLPDLKYLGGPLKKLKRPYALAFIHPNPYWIGFLKELRDYLGHPQENKLDIIAHHLQEGDLPQQSIQYLRGLYT